MAVPGNYQKYQDETTDEIKSLIADLNCQPILFIGSGISRRYFGGPSWDELLEALVERCPLCDKQYAYYKQKHGSPLETGTALSSLYFEWAWSTGQNEFPKEIFEKNSPQDAYLKYYIAEHLKKITPQSAMNLQDPDHKAEIAALQKVRPHAVITTNYDLFLEKVFPDYTPIVGQKILYNQTFAVGEILKIHGCVSDPSTMVVTSGDYDAFLKKKKYLSAKLLTHFSEHPVLIAGYSAEDRNIRAILSDIDEALPIAGDTIKNIYFLEWAPNANEANNPAKEKLLAIDDSKSVRVKCIQSTSYEWVFDAFRSPDTINKVSPKILRALMARSYELVRHDIPRKSIQADFAMLEGAVASSEEFAKLLGITTIQDPSHTTAQYPYSLTTLGQKLGCAGWHGAQKIIDKIIEQKGVDIKASDNKYHVTMKVANTKFHKYSNAALTLLTAAKEGDPYDI